MFKNLLFTFALVVITLSGFSQKEVSNSETKLQNDGYSIKAQEEQKNKNIQQNRNRNSDKNIHQRRTVNKQNNNSGTVRQGSERKRAAKPR